MLERRPTRRRLLPLLLAAAAPLGSAACAGDAPRAPDAPTTTIDTLASGSVVVRNEDVPLWGEGEAWTLRERARIGALDGDGPDVFGSIGAVEVGPDGNIYVLDRQASEIRVFSPDGEHLRTFGRPGPGPGELGSPAGMAFDTAGTLWVLNWGNNRFTGFWPETGEVVDEVSRQSGFVFVPWPGRFDASNRLLDVGHGPDGQPAIIVLDPDFTPRDTLPLPRPDERYLANYRRDGVVLMTGTVPFAPQPSWAPHPSGGILVGDGAVYRLHRIAASGDTLATHEVLREPVPVSRREREEALAMLRERLEVVAGAAGGATLDGTPDIPRHQAGARRALHR